MRAIRMVYSLLKLNLTYAQVGCILKYTRPAYWASDIPASHSYLMKKPGYYLAEEAFVDRRGASCTWASSIVSR